MKMLVVAHDSNFSGGANRSLFMVITQLIEEYNVEVKVLLPKKNGELNNKLDEENIEWISYPYFGVVSGIRNDGKDILRYLKVYIGFLLEWILAFIVNKKLSNEHFDIVYTNTRLPIVGAEIAKKRNIPHVCHVREFGTSKPLWGFWDYKKIYKKSDKIILISHALYAKFKEHVPENKLVTIHNGINSPLDLKYNSILNNENTKSGELFNLIIVGRLVPDKGHDDAIKALKILKDKGYSNIRLHIVGSTPARTRISWYKKKLEEQVSESNLNEEIIYHGEVKDMISLRSKMNVELMCALKETFGRVTVEGMRSGLVVIGANTGGTVEIIDDEVTGLLYEQGRPVDLAEKIEKVYLDTTFASKIAKQGYEFSQNNFTAEKNVSEIYQVLNQL